MARLLEEDYIQLKKTTVYFDDGREKHQVTSATRVNYNQDNNGICNSDFAGYYLELANSSKLTLNILNSEMNFVKKEMPLHTDSTEFDRNGTAELNNWINSGINVFLF
uniref:Uncharacterized protein n=2 Tax=Vibrio nigripulchritudo TaxID=28173 RepID=A0A9P1JLD9_9VIBR|nr:Protein of unknown function [Vibrio nigripulchritudo]